MAWFETWFDTPYYHILYKNRDFEEAEHFISLLVKDLQIPEHSKIIELKKIAANIKLGALEAVDDLSAHGGPRAVGRSAAHRRAAPGAGPAWPRPGCPPSAAPA